MDFKRYIPHITAVILFAIITALFFKPLVFDGKKMKQGDVDHFLGVSKEISDYREKTGKEALWTNSLFGGMPAYQIAIKYPNNLVQYLQKFFIAIMPAPATVILLCMIGFYFLLTTMKVDPWLSIAGAIAFGLSSYFIIILTAGHNTKGFAIAYMAPVLMGLLLTMRGRLFLGAALTALALALEIYSNHLQITYYLLILVVFVGIGESVRLYKEKKLNYLLKAIGLLFAAAFLAVLPNLTNLMLTEEYGKYSTRGKSDITIDNADQKKTSGLPIEYATQWSYGVGETWTLLVPDFNGGASEAIATYDPKALDAVDQNWKENIGQNGAYFGDQPFTSGPVYVGAIIFFLFILGMFIVRDNLKWWLFAATLLSIMLAWGKNFEGFTEFFFDNVPGYNKFRAVSMILVIAELTIPLLAMLALKEIIKDPARLKARRELFFISLGLSAGIALLFAIMPTVFVSPVSETETTQIIEGATKQGATRAIADEYIMNLEQARLSIVTSDAWRSFGFILLAGTLLFIYIRKPFKVYWLAAGVAFLVLIDMAGVASRYIDNDTDYEKTKKVTTHFEATQADNMILSDKSPDYRVLNVAANTWSDANTSYFHKSIGGYHGAKLKRIQELYENVMEKDILEVRTALQSGSDSIARGVLAKQASINMLNTKYIIYSPEGGVLVNSTACGNAWFVDEVKQVANADEEIKTVANFNPKKTAIVDKVFADQLQGAKPNADPNASIKLVSYEPNDLKYESNASSQQVAVFSEIYYDKGWNAYVDGKLTPHFRTDFVLRGMVVPAGKHTIEFKFEPSFYFTGEKIALFGSILLILFVGGGIFLDWKKKAATKVAEKEKARAEA
jgi:hypothetical protein